MTAFQHYSAMKACALALTLSALTGLIGCSSQTVKTANHAPLQRETAELREEYLLDVGIQVFDPGLDRAVNNEDLLIFPEVRKAESRYIPLHLMEALQNSAAWGAVRVVPNEKTMSDVLVSGEILQSDGELLLIHVSVNDASGRHWFTKVYQGLASKYSYDRQRSHQDPFQGIYNRVANDMLEYRKKLSEQNIAEIRTIAELRFAQSFSPEAYDQHLVLDKNGRYEISRLPASNDPMLERIHRIRERDYIFVDTLQEYYGSFVRDMDRPYQEWRKQTYEEVIDMRNLQRSARNRTIAGIAAIVAGIAASGSSSGASRAAGQVGIVGGAYTVKSGFDKRAESKLQIEILQELGDSLESEIEPRVVELEDRTITLSGTVENQYDQWRDILQEIYLLDTQGTIEQQ
ncbi:hypothetical protein NBRC116493_05960 [Aurantivibrio infirmus]